MEKDWEIEGRCLLFGESELMKGVRKELKTSKLTNWCSFWRASTLAMERGIL